jgi:putative oxidoreductase
MNLGLLVLRLVVGLLFMGHGAQKLFGWFGGHGPDGTGAFFESIGLRPGRRNALAAGASELVGGALLALGLLTPVGAALLTATMLTAIWTVHRHNGLWVTESGIEYNLVLLAVLFAVSAAGAGAWSLDHALRIADTGAGWALAQLGAGALGAWGAMTVGRIQVGRRTHGAQPTH